MVLLSWATHLDLLLFTFLADYSQGASAALIIHGQCICSDGNGTYNLAPLQRTDNIPRFHARGRWHYIFYYNPCSSFQKLVEEDEGCNYDVAVCRAADNGGTFCKIGDQSSAWCDTDTATGRPQLVYKTAEYDEEEYNVRVQLICDRTKTLANEAEFKKIEHSKLPWVFSLSHLCACPNGCPVDPSTSVGTTMPSKKPTTEKWFTPVLISLGSVILLVLTVLLVWFFIRLWKNNRNNEMRQRLLDGGQHGGEAIQNNQFPNVSQPIPTASSARSCSDITVCKKDEFNSVKVASGPV